MKRLRRAIGGSVAMQEQVWALVTDALPGKHVRWVHAEGLGPFHTGKTALGQLQVI